MKKIEIFSDGACSGNPGPGGYGTILRFGDTEKELSAGYKFTTNNRMELRGVICGLESLKEPCSVTVTTDSQYIVNSVEKGWARTWRSNNWTKKKGKVINPDLWKRLLELCDTHTVNFKWIRGHNGHVENERCDSLAVAAISGNNLKEDTGYLP